VLDEQPGLRACGGNLLTSSPSEGALRVLPSAVQDVTIDSARWRTYVGPSGLGFRVLLVYTARVLTKRLIPLDSIALIYRATGTPKGWMAAFVENGWGWSTVVDVALRAPILTAEPNAAPADYRDFAIIPAGSAILTERDLDIDQGGFVIMPSNGANVCPQSVQVVRRQELLRYLLPDEVTPSRLKARLAARPRAVQPLEVAFDTLLPDGLLGELVAGVALNTTDSALPPMVAAIVVDNANPILPSRVEVPDSLRTRDTLEYYLGPIGPREIRTFVGGRRSSSAIVVDRVTYPAASVQGRPVATGLNRHWVSWARYKEPYLLKEVKGELR
jgi:hypothetical protein